MAHRLMLFIVSFAIIGIGSMATSGYAQGPPQDAESRMQRLSEGLQLSPDQIEEVRYIMAEGQKRLESAKTEKDQYPEDMNRLEKEIRTEIDNQILAVLNPEQQEKYKRMLKAKPSDKSLRELKERLFLNRQQMQSIESLLITSAEQIEALKQDPENKDPRKYHHAMKKIMDAQAKEIEKLLTDAQIEEFRKMRKEQEKKMKKKGPPQRESNQEGPMDGPDEDNR